MPEAAEDLQARIRQAVRPDFGGRLLDRGLARGLVWWEGQLPPEAPPFAASLTEDLIDYAHALLSLALRLRDLDAEQPILRRAFLVAGEALEAAIHRGDQERTERGFHQLSAAVSFHLGRYAARAYSILPARTPQKLLSPSEKGIYLLLRRRLDELRDLLSGWLLDETHQDEQIAARLGGPDGIDADDAVHEVLTNTLMRGLALLDHGLRTGRDRSAAEAQELFADGAAAAAELHSVPHWWTLTLASHLAEDLWRYSLHNQLREEPPDERGSSWNDLRRHYILRLRRSSIAAIELWPSQIEGARRAVDVNDDLVLALPTGAGKTRVAELCILRTLADDQRVVYVTPLRALSAQIERDLSSTFGPLGYDVSSLYGSAGIEAGDTDILRGNTIVVSTPEKLDFALRNHPDIIDDVGLIVLDEGHMLGPGEREVRYEALVQRLLRRPDASGRRIVCLSALFPEPEQLTDFVEWIRRDTPGDPVHSGWRPTRQRFGWIRWERDAARLQVQVEQEVSYVPRFVESTPPPQGRRRNNFPNNKNELTLAAAWGFVDQDKDVLIYSPLRRSVEALGRLVLDCVRQGVLPSRGVESDRVREAIAAGREWIGADHPAVRCLEHGVALHHGGLPRQFLAHVERLLGARDCRVTIASPTLAQGLNLSASVLLIPSIWRRGEIIPTVEFANVVGRAGRAFVDLEGLVLHVIWESSGWRTRRAIRNWEELLAKTRASDIGSGILELAMTLFVRIEEAAGIPRHQVIEYVLGQDAAWDFSQLPGEEDDRDSAEAEWQKDLASLDAALLALLDPETVEDLLQSELEEVLEGSLFTRQLRHAEDAVQSLIRAFLEARAQLIWSQTTSAQRRGYHVAGVGLQGGRFLDTHLDELLGLLMSAEAGMAVHNAQQVTDALGDLAGLLFQTPPFRPPRVPDQWRGILTGWLTGSPAADLVAGQGADGVQFLQDGIVYRLSWALEAVRVHALALEHPSAPLIEGYAAMAVEAGSINLAAITLLRAALTSRQAAHAVVASTHARFEDPQGMREWLRSPVVRRRSRLEDWPTEETRAEWLRFLATIDRAESRGWRRDTQEVGMEWTSSDLPPEPDTDVVLEPVRGEDGGLVLLPDFTRVGWFRPGLRHELADLVSARVGPDQRTVEVEYFGPLSPS